MTTVVTVVRRIAATISAISVPLSVFAAEGDKPEVETTCGTATSSDVTVSCGESLCRFTLRPTRPFPTRTTLAFDETSASGSVSVVWDPALSNRLVRTVLLRKGEWHATLSGEALRDVRDNSINYGIEHDSVAVTSTDGWQVTGSVFTHETPTDGQRRFRREKFVVVVDGRKNFGIDQRVPVLRTERAKQSTGSHRSAVLLGVAAAAESAARATAEYAAEQYRSRASKMVSGALLKLLSCSGRKLGLVRTCRVLEAIEIDTLDANRRALTEAVAEDAVQLLISSAMSDLSDKLRKFSVNEIHQPQIKSRVRSILELSGGLVTGVDREEDVAERVVVALAELADAFAEGLSDSTLNNSLDRAESFTQDSLGPLARWFVDLRDLRRIFDGAASAHRPLGDLKEGFEGGVAFLEGWDENCTDSLDDVKKWKDEIKTTSVAIAAKGAKLPKNHQEAVLATRLLARARAESLFRKQGCKADAKATGAGSNAPFTFQDGIQIVRAGATTDFSTFLDTLEHKKNPGDWKSAYVAFLDQAIWAGRTSERADEERQIKDYFGAFKRVNQLKYAQALLRECTSVADCSSGTVADYLTNGLSIVLPSDGDRRKYLEAKVIEAHRLSSIVHHGIQALLPSLGVSPEARAQHALEAAAASFEFLFSDEDFSRPAWVGGVASIARGSFGQVLADLLVGRANGVSSFSVPGSTGKRDKVLTALVTIAHSQDGEAGEPDRRAALAALVGVLAERSEDNVPGDWFVSLSVVAGPTIGGGRRWGSGRSPVAFMLQPVSIPVGLSAEVRLDKHFQLYGQLSALDIGQYAQLSLADENDETFVPPSLDRSLGLGLHAGFLAGDRWFLGGDFRIVGGYNEKVSTASTGVNWRAGVLVGIAVPLLDVASGSM